MISTELRIGNLVEWNNEIGIISQLFEMEVVFKCGESDLYTALKPIPLTEEWLLKFGFNKQGNTIYKELNGFEFGTINTNRSKPRFYLQTQGSTSNITLPIKFVHQLQNLYFALTGEELILKNK